MTGSYICEVYNNKLRYILNINRSITIIKGNSGTGKSTLIDLIKNVIKNKKTYNSNMKDKLAVFDELTDWRLELIRLSNKIIFIDEFVNYIYSHEFADIAQKSDNYFVFITRKSMDNYVYSYKSIYELETVKKDKVFETSLVYKFNNNINFNTVVKPDVVLCEDSKSSYDMLGLIIKEEYLESAFDKDNIVNILDINKKYYIIADGAGFGNCIEKVSRKINNGYKAVLLLEESFEYIILTYKEIYNKYKEFIDNPEKYADTKRFKSYERYYTWLLDSILIKLYNKHYNKSKIPKELNNSKIRNHIKSKLKLLDSSVYK